MRYDEYLNSFGERHPRCLPLEQHFGLGTATHVDALEIRWPSGMVQRVEKPPVNQTIRVIEGQAGWEYVYQQRIK
jgi:hypothetical protein